MRKRACAVVAVIGVLAAFVAAFAAALAWRPAPFDAWPDTDFGAIVTDATTGATLVAFHAHDQFRSASLVKLLIALDLLERPGPPLAASDRAIVASMLRASDDDAANVLWVRDGYDAIVDRMIDRLGLTDTEPPAIRTSWGYTATSAADIARVYRHLITEAPPAVGAFVLGQLRATTRCAVDGHDQHVGVPRATTGPWASKQGWSGVGDVAPGDACTPAPPSAVDPDAAERAAVGLPRHPPQTGSDPDIDLTRPAVHTSGVVGPHTIVVVLSLSPAGTSYDEAARRVDDVTRRLVASPARP